MGDRYELDEDIAAYYAEGKERVRLTAGSGRLELLRTQELLARYLPPAPAIVLDVGGGPGVYALPLAAQGYDVHLVDPVALHVEQAKAASDAQAEAPLGSAVIGDARRLDWSDGSVDTVLLLGPLYHLPDRVDRVAALHEASRVLRSDGVVVAAAISRFASAIDGVRHGFLGEPEFQEIVDRDLREGEHRNPTRREAWFTTSYFHRPEELGRECTDAGLTVETLVAIEGPWWLLQDLDDRLDDQMRRGQLLAALRRIESEPSLLGVSAHLLAVGRPT